MDLSSILKPEAVRAMAAVSSKKRLFQDLADLAQTACQLDSANVLNALTERESLGPTGVGHGVALPHARIRELDNVCGALVVLEKPLDFGAPDRLPVDIIFALFAPERSGVEHLKALALVSRTLRDQNLCAKLRANPDPATLYAILTESLPSKAA
jgi:PTS system nitrogen regulatory IIA component